AAEREGKDRQPRGRLLGGEFLARVGLGHRVAARQFVTGERAPIDQEAVDPADLLGQRLAKYRRPAVVGRALTGFGAARPVDLASDDPAGSRRGELRRITGGHGWRRHERERRKDQGWSKHRY